MNKINEIKGLNVLEDKLERDEKYWGKNEFNIVGLIQNYECSCLRMMYKEMEVLKM